MTPAFFHKCFGNSLCATSVTHILSFYKLTLKLRITAPLGSDFLPCQAVVLQWLPSSIYVNKPCQRAFQTMPCQSPRMAESLLTPSNHLSILGSDLVAVSCRVCFHSLLISLKPSHTVYMIFINSPEPSPRPRSGAATALHWASHVEIPHVQGQKNHSKAVGT